jgi:hypothetical protein
MAVVMVSHMMSALPQLRMQPVEKWVRAYVGDEPVVDTRRACLVWEPRRVVPCYAAG